MSKYAANDMWNKITQSLKDDINNFDIHGFKSSKINSRIAQYNCDSHGYLFFRTIIFQFAQTFTPDQLTLLKKIPNRHVGKPIDIMYNGDSICLDYLQALDEALFIKPILDQIATVAEIGAGYGRTCHTILSLFKNIKSYTIIDLPEMMVVSRKYLETVLPPEDFKKIVFVAYTDIPQNLSLDLVINIDSMQEMSADVVRNYLELIDRSAKFFYSKNTLGKFSPEVLNLPPTTATSAALSSGLLTDVLNIFSPDDLKKHAEKFVSAFTPNKGWKAIDSRAAPPWTHYYQALYKRN